MQFDEQKLQDFMSRMLGEFGALACAPLIALGDRLGPFANDRLEDNLNAVGRVYYSASTMICTAASLSQEGQMALGAQAGEARLREVVTKGGFTRFRRAHETPFNLVLEARP
jgi:hypothetical protein